MYVDALPGMPSDPETQESTIPINHFLCCDASSTSHLCRICLPTNLTLGLRPDLRDGAPADEVEGWAGTGVDGRPGTEVDGWSGTEVDLARPRDVRFCVRRLGTVTPLCGSTCQ